VSIDEIVEREVLGEASRALDVLGGRVRDRLASDASQGASELSQFAGAALEAYYETLLRILVTAAVRRTTSDPEVWVKRQFREELDNASGTLRKAFAESPHRHAIAQRLQQKLFEAEVLLRRTLSVRLGEVAVSQPESVPSRKLAAG
jgi:hypothetical protein